MTDRPIWLRYSNPKSAKEVEVLEAMHQSYCYIHFMFWWRVSSRLVLRVSGCEQSFQAEREEVCIDY